MEKLKNKPSLRFPEFDRKWENSKLGDITYKVDKKNKTKELLPIYSINNYNGFTPQSEQFEGLDSNERGYDISLYKIIENKTFAYNPARINVGSIGYSGNLDRVIVSSLYVCFKTKENINDEFFYKFVKSDRFINYVNKMGEGGVRIYLFYENFSLIPFSFPSLAEQTKIASLFTVVDDKLQTLKQKKNLLNQYKKGVMQKIFSQEFRFKDYNGNEYPDWEEKKLNEVANKKSSNISANKIEDNFGDYIIYGASGILKKVDFYKEEDDYISIIKDGAGVGRLLYCKGQSSVLGTMEIIRPNKGINTYYLYYLLSNIDFVKYVTGSTIPHIYFKDYSSEICGLPCLDEQKKIANFLSAIDDKIIHCQALIEKTEVWKKGLFQQMFV
jgi:type I restriction enzyme S subunit